jgi:hypothetical protein
MESATARKPRYQFKTTGAAANPHGRGARKRRLAKAAKEKATRDAVRRECEAALLKRDIPHPAHWQVIIIDEVASLVVEARDLRERGQSTAEHARLISRLIGQLNDARRGDAGESFGEALERHKSATATLAESARASDHEATE